MSLRIWLPLTKDLRNQGLDDVTVTNNGATFNSAGKLGGCYQFGNGSASSNGLFLNSNLVDVMQEEYSVAVWVKPLGNHYHYNGTIFSSGDWNKTRYSFGLSQDNSQVDILCKGHNNYLTCAVPINTWTHLVCTCDSNNIVRLYKNGEYINSSARNDKPDSDNANQAAIGRETYANGYFTFNGMLNDFRLYDHCLSPMEIKQISQGLVLHYPLADKYIENTTNLITTEDCLSTTCYNGAISKYSYGTNTDMYKEVTTFQGKKGTKVYNQTNGTGMYPYVYINNMYTSDGTNSPAYKTLSFDYYTTISTSICPYKLGSGNGTATYIVTNNETRTGTGTNQVAIPVKPNMWNHIEVTFHGITEADAQWGYIQNQPSHTSDTSNFWFFANMQLEEKDHATDYVGIGGSRIYDTSGFCNNGTISGTLTISNDTPKYKVSTYIPTTATITHSRCLDNTNQEWSCAAWVKPKVAGNYQNLNNFNEANRLYHGTYPLLCANGGTNDYYNYGNLALPVNQWSHIVFVFKNSNGMKLIYINGENHTNTGGPNKTSTPKGIPDTVVIGGSYEGGLCDYREYATALSAEDIKSLYNNSAYIDNQGNIYGAVYEEV